MMKCCIGAGIHVQKKKKYARAITLSKIEVQFLLFKTSSTKYKSFGQLLVQ